MSPKGMKQQYLKGVGIAAIAEKSDHSPAYVRKQLVSLKVKIRKAGRPAGPVKKAKKTKRKARKGRK